MSRALWFAAGAASGVYGVVKARRAVQELTPDGLGSRLAALRVGSRVFVDSVAAGMAEREGDLYRQLETAGELPLLISGRAGKLAESRSEAPDGSLPQTEGGDDGNG